MTSRKPRVPAGVLTSFDPAFAGELIDPDHPDYDSARRLYNGVFDKRPGLIARCTSAADVQIALAYAGEHDLIVAVRGGGHSIPGTLVLRWGPGHPEELSVLVQARADHPHPRQR